MQRRNALASLATLATLPFTRWVQAQAWPGSPLRMIVPYATGGGIDAVARLLAQGMAEELKQQVNVDNRAGAGGTLGAEAAARAAPDGLTVLLAGNPELTITPALRGKLPYEPLTDFTPIVLVAQSANVLVASASLGARSAREAFEAARQRPGGITIGTPGNGSPQHIAVELLRSQAGVDAVHVPYKGAGPATLAALSGEVSFALVGAPPALPHITAGKLVALAVTQPQRSPLLPNVPTMGEAMGILRDDDFVAWYGLLAPAKTPAEAVAALERAAFATLKRPEVRARLAALGTDLLATPGPAFAERMRVESKRYAEVIKRFGIKAG